MARLPHDSTPTSRLEHHLRDAVLDRCARAFSTGDYSAAERARALVASAQLPAAAAVVACHAACAAMSPTMVSETPHIRASVSP